MRRRYLPVLLLSAAAALFYLPGLLPGKVLLPLDIVCGVQPWSAMPVCSGRTVANPVLSDQVFAFYPWHEIQRRDGWRGALWNPYAFAGSPLLGNGQSAAFYPPNWLNWILSASWSYVLLAIFHTAVAAISMRAFARRHVSEPAAMLAAISYAFTYNFVFSVGYPFGWSMAWIPALLWAVDSRKWVLTALFAALIMLAGHPETAVVAAFIVGAWFLANRPSGKEIGYAAVSAGAGTILALPQIVPLLKYVLPSAASYFRDQLFPLIYSTHTMLEFLTPAFFGTSAPTHRWGSNDGNFFGLASFLLVVAFMISRPRQAMRNPWTWIFLVSLAFVYGVPPFSWLLNLPHLHIVYANRFWVSATFAGAMLAAHGLDEQIAKRIPKLVSFYLLPASFCVAMLLALWHFRSFIEALSLFGFEKRVVLKFAVSLIATVIVLRWRPSWTAAVVYGECVLYLFFYNTAAPKELLFPKPPVVDFLKKDPERFRIMGDGVFPANTASIYGLEDLRGYDAITPMPWFRAMEQMDPTFPDLLSRTNLAPTGIQMDTLFQRDHVFRMLDKWGETYRELLRHVFYWNQSLTRVDRPDLLDQLNVKYYLVPHGGKPPKGLEDWQKEYAAEVDAYRNPHVYPRAYVVRTGDPAPAAAQILDYLPDEVTIRAEGPGTLVLADAWDPGWRAEGFTISQYRGFFRSVTLNPGSQTVRFKYRPW